MPMVLVGKCREEKKRKKEVVLVVCSVPFGSSIGVGVVLVCVGGCESVVWQ